jgi:hypothetical protein
MSNNTDEPLHDGGLVHEHRWAREPNRMELCTAPLVANPDFLSMPSTIYQDEHVFPADSSGSA